MKRWQNGLTRIFVSFVSRQKIMKKEKKINWNYKVNKCIEILSKDNAVGKFYTLVAS